MWGPMVDIVHLEQVLQQQQTVLSLGPHLRKIEQWTRKWRLKINETKSAHITFILRKGTCPPVYINQTIIPQTDTVKYLGLHFDKRLTWREHVTKIRKHLDLKTRKLIWLIGKHSPLSLTNKLLIYKTVLKPIWTYGLALLALWGCAASSNIAIIQRYQAKILRQITNAPWYVTNHTLHKDLRISQVRTVQQELIDTYRTALQSHPNPLMAQILSQPDSRRLQRRWTLDVIT
jgi:hypothetical protein